jgi:hypothetical protein
MSDMTVSAEAVEEVRPVELSADVLDEQLIGQLVDRARASGLQLTGGGGLLQQLTKRVLESALEGEITDHSATRSMIRLAPAVATAATGSGPRPC